MCLPPLPTIPFSPYLIQFEFSWFQFLLVSFVLKGNFHSSPHRSYLALLQSSLTVRSCKLSPSFSYFHEFGFPVFKLIWYLSFSHALLMPGRACTFDDLAFSVHILRFVTMSSSFLNVSCMWILDLLFWSFRFHEMIMRDLKSELLIQFSQNFFLFTSEW